eukprot:2105079-Prymnesium_polylepis.1
MIKNKTAAPQIGVEIAPYLAVAELDRLAQESAENACRRARHYKKRHKEGQRQRAAQSAGDHGAHADLLRADSGIALAVQRLLERFPADEPNSEAKQEDDGPERADPQACAVVAEAIATQEQVLEICRELEELKQLCVLLETQR